MAFPMAPEISDEPRPRGLSEGQCRALAGIDTGLAAAILFLVWLGYYSWLGGGYWWTRLNVAGAVFYGDMVFHMGLGRATLSGTALLLFLYALLGVVFARFARTRGYVLNLLGGLAFALAWHVFANWAVWKRLHPFAHPYFAPLAVLPGHLLYGFALSRFARRFTRIARTLGDPSWAAAYAPRLPVAEIIQPPPETATETSIDTGKTGAAAPAGQDRSINPDETSRPGGASPDC